MQFKTKLRKIGNSWGVIVPKNVITSNKLGDEITLNVITLGGNDKNVITFENKNKQNVITSKQAKPKVQATINTPDDVKKWADRLDNTGKFQTFFKK